MKTNVLEVVFYQDKSIKKFILSLHYATTHCTNSNEVFISIDKQGKKRRVEYMIKKVS